MNSNALGVDAFRSTATRHANPRVRPAVRNHQKDTDPSLPSSVSQRKASNSGPDAVPAVTIPLIIRERLEARQ